MEEREERDEDSARMQEGKGEMKIDISKQKRYDIYLKWREGKRRSMQE